MSEPHLLRPSRWRRRLAPLLHGLLATAALAVLCNAVLELSQLLGADVPPWRFKTPAYAGMFLLGALVVWLVIGLVHAVVGRLPVTALLAVIATVVVSLADFMKIRLLHEPLYPSDSYFAGDIGFVTDMLSARVLAEFAIALLVAAGLVVVGTRLVRKVFHHRASRGGSPLRRGLVRAGTGVLCLVCIAYLSNFNSPGNLVRGTYDALGADWRAWNQQRNYLGNGFVGGFLFNMSVPPMTKPANYSAAEMAGIAQTYTRVADEINRHRDPHALDDVNVVMVLSETFSDPEQLRGVHIDQDPIPRTRALMRSNTSGKMLAPGVGSGTANVEFEALTGMSLSQFAAPLRVPYQMLVPDYAHFPSVVSWFREQDHRAVAIHPFMPEMYRRRTVYPILGFQDFIYDKLMHSRHRIGHDAYISDESAYDEVLRQLYDEPQPMFVNLVTMQNHMPYAGRYNDPLRVTGPDGDDLDDVGQYSRGLNHTDQALHDFIGRLRRSDEKTVVLFYGDHLPSSYPDSVFRANGKRRMHQTPYFVWANFPGPTSKQPTTSPIHFVDLALERADAAVPPYYALLEELRREVPAMDAGLLVGPDDRRLHPGDLPPRARRLLDDYRLVQYDLSVGKRYSEDAMFGVPAGSPDPS